MNVCWRFWKVTGISAIAFGGHDDNEMQVLASQVNKRFTRGILWKEQLRREHGFKFKSFWHFWVSEVSTSLSSSINFCLGNNRLANDWVSQ